MLDKTQPVILSCSTMQGQGSRDTQEVGVSRPAVLTTASLMTA
jgi:hypothetical protein